MIRFGQTASRNDLARGKVLTALRNSCGFLYVTTITSGPMLYTVVAVHGLDNNNNLFNRIDAKFQSDLQYILFVRRLAICSWKTLDFLYILTCSTNLLCIISTLTSYNESFLSQQIGLHVFIFFVQLIVIYHRKLVANGGGISR